MATVCERLFINGVIRAFINTRFRLCEYLEISRGEAIWGLQTHEAGEITVYGHPSYFFFMGCANGPLCR
tara:strand:+ start:246 stop:452 length:207 start_codon:yes stop_codon:yes gene_type:complete